LMLLLWRLLTTKKFIYPYCIKKNIFQNTSSASALQSRKLTMWTWKLIKLIELYCFSTCRKLREVENGKNKNFRACVGWENETMSV
jgi:hypothetical protein